MAASGVFAGSTVTVTFARTLRRVMSSVARQACVGVDVEGGGVAVGAAVGAAVVGAGVALEDDPPEVRLGDPETIRWNDETTFLGMLALGARYGLSQGLFVAVDVRAYNLAFGGYTLTAGYAF